MKQLATIVLALSVTSIGFTEIGFADETYYTWIDENGVVNYAEQAPVDRDYREYSEGQSQQRAFGYPAQKREDPTPAPPTNVAVSSNPNEVDTSENCRAAQAAMKKLTEFKQIILKDEDGVWREASEERKQQEINVAQQAIEEFC